jgi:hypothetical protein
MQDESINQAERIAVTNLFRAIAAFGRQVRERRAVEAVRQTVKEIQPMSEENEQKMPSK